MISMIDSARKCEVIYGAAFSLKPSEQTCPDLRRNLQLYRTSGFLLDDHCSCSDRMARDESSDLDLNEIAASQLAVGRDIKQRSVS